MNPLPRDRPVFSYYGDDFTGSTDALEALAANGLPAVLFLRVPGADDLRQFAGCRAVGVAGDARSRSPEWMRCALPPVFELLRDLGAPLVQYKVCSTFDSAPETGSIGCALEIGQEVFEVASVPVVAAAPLLGRYVAFGNLFAAGQGEVHRIDRHPSMASHPVTPMDESDLLLHLARQTSRRLALVDILALRANGFEWPVADAVLFDGIEPADVAAAARRIWENRGTGMTFVVGSSGFTYGMLDYWRSEGCLPPAPRLAPPAPANRLLVLAGSCSPTTASQTGHALRNGFHGIRLNPCDRNHAAAEAEAIAQLAAGRSVVLYSALEPSDRVEIEDRHGAAAAMGRLLRRVILRSKVTRVAIAGGDTASRAVQELGISALTFAAPIAHGAPLCRAHGWPHQLELVLKGGQVGAGDFFEKALAWA